MLAQVPEIYIHNNGELDLSHLVHIDDLLLNIPFNITHQSWRKSYNESYNNKAPNSVKLNFAYSGIRTWDLKKWSREH